MSKERLLRSTALIVTAACWGCTAAPESGSARRPLAAADAVVDTVGDTVGADAPVADLSGDQQGASDLQPGADQPQCGAVSAKGCCDGETLWWCASGVLKSERCDGKPKCGWNTSGFYDCNTSGAADPSGSNAQACGTGDAGVPPSDLGSDGTTKPCGGVPLEGCCAGATLRYCEDGVLKVLSCAFNPSCGWFAQGKYYDCGTPGGEDPSGVNPRACVGVAPADSGADQGADSAAAADLGGDSGGEPNGCGSCQAGGLKGGAALGGVMWALLLAALLLALRRRASC